MEHLRHVKVSAEVDTNKQTFEMDVTTESIGAMRSEIEAFFDEVEESLS